MKLRTMGLLAVGVAFAAVAFNTQAQQADPQASATPKSVAAARAEAKEAPMKTDAETEAKLKAKRDAEARRERAAGRSKTGDAVEEEEARPR